MMGDVLVMVKVAERCNISCSYCYMYEGVDQGWRERPKFLADDKLDALTVRLEDHHRDFPAARMTLEIHGGEPLLMGKARADRFLRAVRSRLSAQELLIVTQSNGILVDDEWLDLYARHDATIAISCDGPPAAHDRHRLDLAGAGTGTRVETAIARCIAHPASNRVFNGVLAVIDPNNPPEATID